MGFYLSFAQKSAKFLFTGHKMSRFLIGWKVALKPCLLAGNLTTRNQLTPPPSRDCVVIPFLSLRATEGSVAISEISIPCEIASVVSLPRNDIMTQSPKGEGKGEVILFNAFVLVN
jgi:hypothetical protein